MKDNGPTQPIAIDEYLHFMGFEELTSTNPSNVPLFLRELRQAIVDLGFKEAMSIIQIDAATTTNPTTGK